MNKLKNVLKGQGRYRDLLLFVVGINTALRVSDLLTLQIGDFIDEGGEIRDRFWLREEKRGKRNEVVINRSIREALELYREVYEGIADCSDNFVFSTPGRMTTRNPLAASRPGSLSPPSAAMWACGATTAPTACARPGAAMPG